ncbi:MAG: hypothetical protein U0P30_07630 [Vicinamibacterales bacterium]
MARQISVPSSARSAAKSPPSNDSSSHPVSKVGAAAIVPGSVFCHAGAPESA